MLLRRLGPHHDDHVVLPCIMAPAGGLEPTRSSGTVKIAAAMSSTRHPFIATRASSSSTVASRTASDPSPFTVIAPRSPRQAIPVSLIPNPQTRAARAAAPSIPPLLSVRYPPGATDGTMA